MRADTRLGDRASRGPGAGSLVHVPIGSLGQRGATLAEFAVVFPLLMMLLIGIVEFSWLLAQSLDVRHGAREGARLAVVNYPEGSEPAVIVRTQTNTSDLLQETCARMNIATQVAGTFSSAGGQGDPVSVTFTAPADTITGLLDWVLPSSLSFTSTATLHAEQEATWDNTDLSLYPGGQPCP